MRDQWANWLAPVRALAAEASERILKIYATAFEVTTKDDHSPLTDADLAAHRAILAGLERLTPDVPVLSEESAAVSFAERSTWRRYWLVDPLDGTKEFVQRNGQFTVNIALIEDHEPVFGVVRVPVTGVCYFAARGCGAFRQEPDQPPQPISVTPLQADRPVRVVGSKSHGGPKLQKFAVKLGAHELVTIGSSLKFCQVAEGSADVYPRFGPTSEWDTAAAQAIVEVAGGQVVSMETGQPLRYNTKEALLNPYFIVYGDASGDWLSYVPREG
ncbi:MAG: 3'(2'),5'-bisphosphate nucleotidase CysQ [Candidatus Competibacteraceae bacterium]|nr:3'(2'),5'-bisphosphate nucleotidase CysQ [Candidatus Competibacteraceae bacterium]MBK7982057.1 3'(2'),5'-bisphosphate nucleotidase CysQ [Candidatus Competibacteraceae bacterium]MBK8899336.1 3'(2'),5'-bisphosphate nucleotidase CysQ [Candidatus Competibacteraceae bacterium]MBK8963433.1 3'(2'),5'-bisphosphate nucleotidase CysQ [Candidatus Competibacteraceae bacterium]MBK9952333.1 3'(2'),5'-bisphosphate nucleotidase CysQ [Candidatus Competibacteraceae bacterium]